MKRGIKRYKKGILPFKSIALLCAFACISIVPTSCKKYLDKKPRQNLAIPSTLSDLKAMLDAPLFNASSPYLLEFVADNFYMTTDSWNNLDMDLRKQYIWDPSARITIVYSNWTNPYIAIYRANLVLDILPDISFSEGEREEYESIKGTALFLRAFQFYQLAQLFCRPYSGTANMDPGIVLRLTSDIDQTTDRSTVQKTYDQIINDLKTAVALLPLKTSFSTQPNKAAGYGELARVYLSMSDYDSAAKYAGSSLLQNDELLDYNKLVPADDPSMPEYTDNPEVLFLSQEYLSTVFGSTHRAVTDSTLYQSYDADDLRKTTFYGPESDSYYWKGSYGYHTDAHFSAIFTGLATDEMYLIHAECEARAGNKETAMEALNTLLRKRWKTGMYIDLTAIDATDALSKVLLERRKELAFRGLRWTDLRRFNLDAAGITLKRIINGTMYTLPPNDLRWVLFIPDVEINQSGISQNPR